MKDIAAHLGISVATVSRAINGSENINLETKERILAFVEKRGILQMLLQEIFLKWKIILLLF